MAEVPTLSGPGGLSNLSAPLSAQLETWQIVEAPKGFHLHYSRVTTLMTNTPTVMLSGNLGASHSCRAPLKWFLSLVWAILIILMLAM